VICDGKYGVERFQEDLRFCPRNFLHRFHLSWPDEGGCVEARLPQDLCDALGSLHPVDERSGRAVQETLHGTHLLGDG